VSTAATAAIVSAFFVDMLALPGGYCCRYLNVVRAMDGIITPPGAFKVVECFP
jgi:hypothetical protein